MLAAASIIGCQEDLGKEFNEDELKDQFEGVLENMVEIVIEKPLEAWDEFAEEEGIESENGEEDS